MRPFGSSSDSAVVGGCVVGSVVSIVFSLLSGVLLIYFVVSLVYLCRDSLDSSLQVLLDGGVLCPIHLRSEVSGKR